MSERPSPNMCHLEFDPSVVGSKAITAEEKVAHGLLLLRDASLGDLTILTGLTPEK